MADFKAKGGKRGPKKSLGNKSVPVSKRIRDIKRLLANKPDLAPAARAAQEAKLAALEKEHEEVKRAALERKLAKRYHHVKFFERVKIERALSTLRRRLAADASAPSEEDQARLAQCQEDLNYVMHFPKGEKYVSLLKNAETPEAQAALEAERARLRALVRQQMAEEALVAEPDEGRSLLAASAAAAAAATAAATVKKSSALVKKGTKKTLDSKKGAHDGDDTPEDEEEERDDFFLSEDEGNDEEEEDDDNDGDHSTSEEEMEEESRSEDEEEEDESTSSEDDDDEKGGVIATRPSLRRDYKKRRFDADESTPSFKDGGSRGRGRGRGVGSRGRGGFSSSKGVSPRPIAPPRGPRGNSNKSKPKPQQQQQKAAKNGEKTPLRTRAEGGRKRRRK